MPIHGYNTLGCSMYGCSEHPHLYRQSQTVYLRPSLLCLYIRLEVSPSLHLFAWVTSSKRCCQTDIRVSVNPVLGHHRICIAASVFYGLRTALLVCYYPWVLPLSDSAYPSVAVRIRLLKSTACATSLRGVLVCVAFAFSDATHTAYT